MTLTVEQQAAFEAAIAKRKGNAPKDAIMLFAAGLAHAKSEVDRVQALHTGLMAEADRRNEELAAEIAEQQLYIDGLEKSVKMYMMTIVALRAELAQAKADLSRKQAVIDELCACKYVPGKLQQRLDDAWAAARAERTK